MPASVTAPAGALAISNLITRSRHAYVQVYRGRLPAWEVTRAIHPYPTYPLIKDNEQRLAKLRRQLEDMFRSLHLVHDEVGVASEAAGSEGRPEIVNALSLGVCNRLLSQLKSLTNGIERLGGRTELSEVPEEQPAEAVHAASSSPRYMGSIPKPETSYPRTASSTKSRSTVLCLRESSHSNGWKLA